MESVRKNNFGRVANGLETNQVCLDVVYFADISEVLLLPSFGHKYNIYNMCDPSTEIIIKLKTYMRYRTVSDFFGWSMNKKIVCSVLRFVDPLRLNPRIRDTCIICIAKLNIKTFKRILFHYS